MILSLFIFKYFCRNKYQLKKIRNQKKFEEFSRRLRKLWSRIDSKFDDDKIKWFICFLLSNLVIGIKFLLTTVPCLPAVRIYYEEKLAASAYKYLIRNKSISGNHKRIYSIFRTRLVTKVYNSCLFLTLVNPPNNAQQFNHCWAVQSDSGTRG